MLTFEADSATRQERLGARLASLMPPVFIVYLQGDLGAGKTTLVRGVLRGMGYQGKVRSPTYTLIEPYRVRGRAVCHLDLYRLGDPEELEYLGLRDLLEEPVVMLIEWPEQGRGMLPAADLTIQIHYQGEGRRLELEPLSERAEALIRLWSDEVNG